jgi:anaerobic selenocysteine-containing dehydrogenase
VRPGDDWLYLLTPNTKDRIHSQFGNLQSIRAVGSPPSLQMHPDDARARGLSEAVLVRVQNDRGSFELPLRLDLGIKPGCVVSSNGLWISDGGTVNFCSTGRETDLGHGAAFHENLVRVQRA